MLPGTLGGAVDPPGGRSGSLGFLNYSHPVFEVFKAPRSGDFSGTRIFRYRSLDVGAAAPDARVLARFDDGAVAAAEKRIGAGRVIAWTSSLDDSWNDLALKPIFLPLVHQMLRYLARYEEPAAWRTVGQALDVSERSAGQGDRIALTPSGERIALGAPGRAAVHRAERAGLLRGPVDRDARGPARHRGRQSRSGRVGSVGHGSAGARRGGDGTCRAGGGGGERDRGAARGLRAAAGHLVVSAVRGYSPAGRRNNSFQPAVAQDVRGVIYGSTSRHLVIWLSGH